MKDLDGFGNVVMRPDGDGGKSAGRLVLDEEVVMERYMAFTLEERLGGILIKEVAVNLIGVGRSRT